MSPHKRVTDEDGNGVIYPDLRSAIQGYIDAMTFGEADGDTAVTFHHPHCEIPEEDLINADYACTCLPLRFRLGDLARVGARHAAIIVTNAGYGLLNDDNEVMHDVS